jgi:aspartate carbamoyltransferase catalytic subunit
VKATVAAAGLSQREVMGLDDEVMASTDVLYVTRVQKERFESQADYDAVRDAFIITPATLTKVRGGLVDVILTYQ